jgi:hypothetical protein
MHSTRSRNARLRHTVVCRLRRATSALRDDGQTLDAISAGAGDVVLVGLCHSALSQLRFSRPTPLHPARTLPPKQGLEK